ncbi:MAG: hypothetical protein IT566_01555 [Rhodospirillaceae bacterium]|nr:hypothetical protein [Rhodospirillaceae bacterium]
MFLLRFFVPLARRAGGHWQDAAPKGAAFLFLLRFFVPLARRAGGHWQDAAMTNGQEKLIASMTATMMAIVGREKIQG